MEHYVRWLDLLRTNPSITAAKVDEEAPVGQGLYVLWHKGEAAPECLKVGIAGPRKGKGLRERLQLHFASKPSTSILAKHMAADCELARPAGLDFRKREDRRKFLAERCYFVAVELPEDLPRPELRTFEKWVEKESGLNPRYIGRVKQRPGSSGVSPRTSGNLGFGAFVIGLVVATLLTWWYLSRRQSLG